MKKMIFTLSLALITPAFAAEKVVEFDEAKELSCHKEAKALGCLKSSGEEDANCLEKKKSMLSVTCSAFRNEKSKQ